MIRLLTELIRVLVIAMLVYVVVYALAYENKPKPVQGLNLIDPEIFYGRKKVSDDEYRRYLMLESYNFIPESEQ